MIMGDKFRFACPVPVTFEPGCTNRMGTILKEDRQQKILVVIDPNLAQISVTDPLFESLENEQITYHTYTDIESNPKVHQIDHGAEVANRVDPDAIVAIGGGSAIDTGKGIALAATHAKSINQFQRTEDGKYVTTDATPLPLYTVPTTVGTGSEVTTGIVVTDTTQQKKIVVGAADFTPTHALLDPLLLETLPQSIISSTGMDSFTQAVESYIATGANPITEAMSIQAVEMSSKNIRMAVARRDKKSLEKMQIATTLGAMAFENSGLGLVHGISHPVSAHYDTPHGITNAVLLPYVLEFNLISSMKKYDKMAQVMDQGTTDLSPRESANVFIEAVQKLNEDLNIPSNLRELGVEREKLSTIAEEVISSKPSNPREYELKDIELILQNAY